MGEKKIKLEKKAKNYEKSRETIKFFNNICIKALYAVFYCE